METGFQFTNLCYTYHTLDKETTALSKINFHLAPGEFISLVGPSGCGKSTLLNLIAGLLPLESGSMCYQEKPIAKANLSIGYMLQKDYLLEWRTIYRNITLGLEIQKKKDAAILSRIDDMLKTYGLWEFKDVYPRQLSGGMRQRAALIRTLALSPDLLLLDEPFSALDYQTRLHVSDDIGQIIREQNVTTILVTHDLNEAIAMADRVIVLSSRPGTIKVDIPIALTTTDHRPSQHRNAPEFNDYFNFIWKEVDTYE